MMMEGSGVVPKAFPQLINISEHPELEPQVREKLVHIRLMARKPCAGRVDTSSEVCSRCEDRVRCGAKQGSPRLQVYLVEAEVLIRMGGRR